MSRPALSPHHAPGLHPGAHRGMTPILCSPSVVSSTLLQYRLRPTAGIAAMLQQKTMRCIPTIVVLPLAPDPHGFFLLTCSTRILAHSTLDAASATADTSMFNDSGAAAQLVRTLLEATNNNNPLHLDEDCASVIVCYSRPPSLNAHSNHRSTQPGQWTRLRWDQKFLPIFYQPTWSAPLHHLFLPSCRHALFFCAISSPPSPPPSISAQVRFTLCWRQPLSRQFPSWRKY